MHAIQSAMDTLSDVQRLQALTERVLDQQSQRLMRRWSVAVTPITLAQKPQVTKVKRTNKGFEGLHRKKANYSKYMDGLTEKHQQVFSLRYEYGLTVTEIASRLGIDRSTVYEHIGAIDKKLQQFASSKKRIATRAKGGPEE